MDRKLDRRQALAKVGGAALGVGAVLVLSEEPAAAAAPTVRGAWLIAPTQRGRSAGLQAIACFAAGGVFITTGSDEPGTGLGQWSSVGTNGFAFTYLNFHFGKNGKLSNTVKVRATGTFSDSTLKGQATLTVTDAYGAAVGKPGHFAFTGHRIAVEAP